MLGLAGLAWLSLGVGVTFDMTGVACPNLGVPLGICGVPLRLGGCWLRWVDIVDATAGCACCTAEPERGGLPAP